MGDSSQLSQGLTPSHPITSRKAGCCRIPAEHPEKLADRVGFEPTVLFPAHTLSRRARSTTPASVLIPVGGWAALWCVAAGCATLDWAFAAGISGSVSRPGSLPPTHVTTAWRLLSGTVLSGRSASHSAAKRPAGKAKRQTDLNHHGERIGDPSGVRFRGGDPPSARAAGGRLPGKDRCRRRPSGRGSPADDT